MHYNITMTNKIHFFPAKNEPQGVIVISHGMAEHLGRYDWFINQLNHDGVHFNIKTHKLVYNEIIKKIEYLGICKHE